MTPSPTAGGLSRRVRNPHLALRAEQRPWRLLSPSAYVLLLLIVAILATPLVAESDRVEPSSESAPSDVLHAGVFERLKTLLTEIPGRWETIPEPRVPFSGQGPNEVFAKSTATDSHMALRFTSALARTPIEHREASIDAWADGQLIDDEDIWVPILLIQQEQLRSLPDAALVAEAWLQWLERLGYKHALLWAASEAIDLVHSHSGALRVKPYLGPWCSLAVQSDMPFAIARLAETQAWALLRMGDINGAIEGAATAFRLSHASGDLLGQGRARQSKRMPTCGWETSRTHSVATAMLDGCSRPLDS